MALEAGKYAQVELERRYLLERLPDAVGKGHLIVDHYVTGSRLRLRRFEGPAPQWKLSQKEAPTPPDYATTTITTIYLSPEEYELLRVLPARELRKRRTHLGPYAIDAFEGELAGLILAEAEFACEEEMRSHAPPDFVGREVSNDIRYTGAWLASNGIPS